MKIMMVSLLKRKVTPEIQAARPRVIYQIATGLAPPTVISLEWKLFPSLKRVLSTCRHMKILFTPKQPI